MTKLYKAIGLMSGTSLDGVDVAMIETDGVGHVKPLGFMGTEYPADFRDRMRACFRSPQKVSDRKDPYPTVEEKNAVREAARESTLLHAQAVKDFMAAHKIRPEEVDLIGFPGQTTYHCPSERLTIQIGDGALLAAETEIDVINDFRTADVLAGGQGAPLVPLYHRALAADMQKPVAILNIGGISNVTLIAGESDDKLFAFDTGMGNALINDWVLKKAGLPYDKDGELASKGKIDQALIEKLLSSPYFLRKPPKSLDRSDLEAFVPDDSVSLEDGAATLTMMTVEAIALGMRQAGSPVKEIYLTGGGRHNKTMARWISEKTGARIGMVDDLGWSGDGLEAEAFAYLAVRSYLGLTLTVPGTTGSPEPTRGGKLSSVRPSTVS